MPEIREYARYIFGTFISLMLIFFAVRPLVNHLIKGKTTASTPSGNEQEKLAAAKSDAYERQSTPLDGALERDSKNEQPEQEGENIALPKIGSDFEEQIAHMQLLASRETERVTSVIKYWVEQGVEVESSKSR